MYLVQDEVNLQKDPLNGIQPEYELGRATYHSATLLHRLVQLKDVATITKRKEELKPEVVK